MKKNSKQLKFPSPRAWDDIYSFKNLAFPDLTDIPRLTNRIGNNLIYYQTNYIVLFFCFFFTVSLTHPIQFLTGLGVFIFLCTVIIAFAEQIIHRQSLVLKRFQIKKELNKPVFKVLNLIFGNGFIFKILGSFALFLFSIVLPLALIFVHAALRQRNVKNKLANKMERMGITRTPMSVLLQKLDWYLNEIYDKFENDKNTEETEETS